MKDNKNQISKKYYFSKYNNIIDLEERHKVILYNSLTGNIVFLKKNIYKDILKMKANIKNEIEILRNKFIFNDEFEEKILEKNLAKISENIVKKKLKVHIFLNKYYNDKVFLDSFLVELSNIVKKNSEKKITLYIYVYSKFAQSFYKIFNNFFFNRLPEYESLIVFVIDPLVVEFENIFSLNNIKRKSVVAIIDPNSFNNIIHFNSYLEEVYHKIERYPQIGIGCTIIFNITKKYLSVVEDYFSFFMKKGEIRFNYNIAINPVDENFQLKRNHGLFCYPDYDLFYELLKFACSSPKYFLLNIVGYGLILKIRHFLFDKNLILPSLGFCEKESQIIYDANKEVWTDCFDINTKNAIGAKEHQKCKDCSFLFICTKGCPLKESRNCPSFEDIFKLIYPNLANAYEI